MKLPKRHYIIASVYSSIRMLCMLHLSTLLWRLSSHLTPLCSRTQGGGGGVWIYTMASPSSCILDSIDSRLSTGWLVMQAAAEGWTGSRGDVRLLARLGLSQAGLQDERDAAEKALAAKNRWRRKSSSKGWLRNLLHSEQHSVTLFHQPVDDLPVLLQSAHSHQVGTSPSSRQSYSCHSVAQMSRTAG